MFGYPYCAMFRGNKSDTDLKKTLENAKEEIKKELTEKVERQSKIIDIRTRREYQPYQVIYFRFQVIDLEPFFIA